MRYTFTAYERLKREQHIDTLFRTGKAYSVFPLKLLYLKVPRPEGEWAPVRIAFSVPKKKFRHATDRNRVKRLLREAWRLNKHLLYREVPAGVQYHLFLLYLAPALPEWDTIRQAVLKAIRKLQEQEFPPTAAPEPTPTQS